MENKTSSYAATRDRLSEFLIRATLIESYHSFSRHDKPYPFAAPESLQLGISTAAYEHPFQRSALILVVDGPLPASLRKHIRFRSANEMTAANLSRLAPEIAEDLIPPQGLSMADEGFPQSQIEAAINTIEFSLRENNTGSFPRGISLTSS